MSYPYPHRNRPSGNDAIELHKRGDDDGTGITISGTLSDSTDVNLPYNEWHVHGAVWANNIDQDLTVQVIPYVDHGQTIDGPAFALSQPGTAAAANSITLSATATGSVGAIFHVLGGAVSGGIFSETEQYDGLSPVHGMKVVVSSTAAVTSTGAEFDWELVCVPEA
jgi:hypothetical protein